MGKDVAEISVAARTTFEHADAILGWGLSKLCFEGPADRLMATDVSQPAIFVTSVALWRACEERGLSSEWAPQAMAGLSLGEYTALHLAGWFSFEDGLGLVAERGRLMQAAAQSSQGSMVSIMGVDEPTVAAICREAAQDDVLAPANFNCSGQIVISGGKAACERSVAIAEKHGARAIPLVVAGAFHSPLMQSAVEGLEKALADTRIARGALGVVSNVSADYHADSESVRRLLREQVAKPIRWQASIERLVGEGFDRFVEVGPGRVLTGLMRKIDRAAKAINVSTADAFEKVSV
jgi:[acyl-carrier-protein] S-malonyltransferase